MNIYIGNMSFNTTEEHLRQAFEDYGEVSTVKIVADRNTGKPRGFAFIEMSTKAEATEAIRSLNGAELDGRNLKVDAANSRKEGDDYNGGKGYRRSY